MYDDFHEPGFLQHVIDSAIGFPPFLVENWKNQIVYIFSSFNICCPYNIYDFCVIKAVAWLKCHSDVFFGFTTIHSCVLCVGGFVCSYSVWGLVVCQLATKQTFHLLRKVGGGVSIII